MYNFYPGPSRIYPVVKDFATEAFESGILEKNHRSDDFMQLMRACTDLLKDRLNIPFSYKVFFTSSATECWEICAQSLLKDPLFYYNGAFGEKWKFYSEKITHKVEGHAFGVEEEPEISVEERDVCIVANETSNGTAVSDEIIRKIRRKGRGLLVIDAVSSLGGVDYDMASGDIWIGCSQKCLGLPSGMGILILSPAAQERAKELNDRRYYNSALFMQDNFDRFQTPYTPNILAIYLLKRLLDQRENISVISAGLKRRATDIYQFVAEDLLVSNPKVQSPTVVAVRCNEVDRLTDYLSHRGITVGKGYGPWRDTTFRIANFPAIPDGDFVVLFDILRSFVNQ